MADKIEAARGQRVVIHVEAGRRSQSPFCNGSHRKLGLVSADRP
jgi:CDGSH-type Zn-finger protein